MHWFPFILPGGERHCERKASFTRTQHHVPSQGSNPDHLIRTESTALTPWPLTPPPLLYHTVPSTQTLYLEVASLSSLIPWENIHIPSTFSSWYPCHDYYHHIGHLNSIRDTRCTTRLLYISEHRSHFPGSHYLDPSYWTSFRCD